MTFYSVNWFLLLHSYCGSYVSLPLCVVVLVCMLLLLFTHVLVRFIGDVDATCCCVCFFCMVILLLVHNWMSLWDFFAPTLMLHRYLLLIHLHCVSLCLAICQFVFAHTCLFMRVCARVCGWIFIKERSEAERGMTCMCPAC